METECEAGEDDDGGRWGSSGEGNESIAGQVVARSGRVSSGDGIVVIAGEVCGKIWAGKLR